MLEIEQKKDNGKIVLKLKGEASIENAEKIHKSFLQFINNNETLLLDLDEVEKVDISFLQILAALCKTLNEKKGEILFLTSLPKPLEEALIISGYFRYKHCIFDHGKSCWINEMIRSTEGG
ncbi:MAG: hypothetical protein DRP87_13795 [Spirochaetes bacterium]|nr:MAG: hypothetical protein DRP87_13795 [Spirochaetota bacterium]